jgi:hypothetical protein
MLKNILNLDGAQQLSKIEQKTINGGKIACSAATNCGPNMCCSAPTSSFGGDFPLGGYCAPINSLPAGRLCIYSGIDQ